MERTYERVERDFLTYDGQIIHGFFFQGERRRETDREGETHTHRHSQTRERYTIHFPTLLSRPHRKPRPGGRALLPALSRCYRSGRNCFHAAAVLTVVFTRAVTLAMVMAIRFDEGGSVGSGGTDRTCQSGENGSPL